MQIHHLDHDSRGQPATASSLSRMPAGTPLPDPRRLLRPRWRRQSDQCRRFPVDGGIRLADGDPDVCGQCAQRPGAGQHHPERAGGDCHPRKAFSAPTLPSNANIRPRGQPPLGQCARMPSSRRNLRSLRMTICGQRDRTLTSISPRQPPMNGKSRVSSIEADPGPG